MRRLSLLLASLSLSFGLLAYAAEDTAKVPGLNTKILTFCKKAVGKKVGDGQCADLAYQALMKCGAESPDDFRDNPLPGDYVWGELVYGYKVQDTKHLETGDRKAVLPGDVIQMRDVVIEHEETSDEYITKETIDADHHTAVVSEVSKDGMTYQVIEQNANEVPTVTTGTLQLHDMKGGYILVYRARADEDSLSDPNSSGNRQGDENTLRKKAKAVHRAVHRHK